MAGRKNPKGGCVPRCVDCDKPSELLQCLACAAKADKFRIDPFPRESGYRSDRRINGDIGAPKVMIGH